jgi:chromosome segregation ATPase
LQVTLNYNPVWASYKPTIVVFALSSVCCISVVFYKKLKPKEIINTPKTKTSTTKTAQTKTGTAKAVPVKNVQATPELTSKFLDVYQERRELFDELKALDLKVHKGRIPRSQYKNQKHAIDARIEGLTHSINKSKELFRQSSPELADLTRQLELAEADLTKAQNRLAYLETQRNSGQITIEEYKENIGSLEEAKDSADVEIDGILLRLREKMQ